MASKVIGVLPGGTAEEPPKKARRMSKDTVRRKFLQKLPKGGVAVEIGVWQGEFSATIIELIAPEKLVLIDPWAHIEDDSHAEAFVGRTGKTKMDKIFDGVVKQFEAQIAAGQVAMIRDFSVPALAQFADQSISFAYVDGDHSYEGVSADLAALFPKMKRGGIMAFDDYHRRGWWGDGVIRAINEFLGAHPRDLRIRAVVGAQIAIEVLDPTDQTA
ncbi:MULTISPECIES: class I SAM-dependent methyltransferase [unclassified Yoonia]|uniref:class I SAM-dependent methyltransferase n=1 Tax=unclassified Yoonia TaxID=2629118 RepID=UPI002AFF02BC|nr:MULTISPECIES: class I SAM-dependent methyltransferase [unclassified Yoonia]